MTGGVKCNLLGNHNWKLSSVCCGLDDVHCCVSLLVDLRGYGAVNTAVCPCWWISGAMVLSTLLCVPVGGSQGLWCCQHCCVSLLVDLRGYGAVNTAAWAWPSYYCGHPIFFLIQLAGPGHNIVIAIQSSSQLAGPGHNIVIAIQSSSHS